MILAGLEEKKSTQILFWLCKYLCAQLFEEMRFCLLKPFLYFSPKKHRSLLLDLRKRGYVIIKNYYDSSAIDSINSEVGKVIRPLLANDYPGLSVIPGSMRFRRPENISLLFRSLSREPYWIAINAIYTGSLRFPGLMLSFTEKNSKEDELQFFADHPHFDAYQHEIKVVVALSDVDENSGPTEIAVASSQYHWGYWKEYFSSWLDHQGVLESKTKTISEEFYLGFGCREKILLSPGDVAIFDSRHIHRATPLIQGKRELLWYYF